MMMLSILSHFVLCLHQSCLSDYAQNHHCYHHSLTALERSVMEVLSALSEHSLAAFVTSPWVWLKTVSAVAVS